MGRIKTTRSKQYRTSRIGPEPLPGTVKVEHMFPMRSLDKGTEDEDIIHFVTQSTLVGRGTLLNQSWTVQHCHWSMSQVICTGPLHEEWRAREDVTLNAKLVANVPQRLNIPIDCHVRGEVVMPLATFDEKYREVSPNPRNLCSGALRQKHGDGKAEASDLVFWAYDVKFPNESPDAVNDSELLSWLQKAGIEPAPWEVFDSETPQKDMIAHTEKWRGLRASYEFEIDGIVFKLDNLEQRENLGMTAHHHPRWA